MTIDELLTMLGNFEVSLRAGDGKIHYSSKSRLPNEFVDGLRKYKSSLLSVLSDISYQDVVLAPLSYNQQSLWITHQMDPTAASYNVVLPLHILSPVDVDRIRTFVSRVAAKHTQLRALFRTISDDSTTVPCQIIPTSAIRDFTQVDRTSWSQSQIDTCIHGFTQKSFDLVTGPPYRTLCLTGVGDTYVVFTFHHIVIDAVSLGVFLREFEWFFETGELKRDDSLPYTAFVAAQKRETHDNMDSWLSHFKPRILSNASLRVAVSDSSKGTGREGNSLYFGFVNNVPERLKAYCQRRSITPFSFFFACFQVLCAYSSKQKTIQTGVLFNGRSATEAINTIGYFVNPLPITTEVDHDREISEWFRDVHREILSTVDVQVCPFSLLMEHFSSMDLHQGTPRFFNLFNMLTQRQLGKGATLLYPMGEDKEITIGGLQIKPYPLNQQEGQFDLTMELVDRERDVQGILKYDTSLFSRHEAEKLALTYRDVVDCCLEDTSESIAALFEEMDRRAAEREGYRSVCVSIAATFTATVLSDFLEFWKTELGIRSLFEFEPYAQIEQPLIAYCSQADSNRFLFVLLRLEDLCHSDEDEKPNVPDIKIIEARMKKIASIIQMGEDAGQNRIVLIFCPPSNAVAQDRITWKKLTDLESTVADSLEKDRKAVVLTSSALLHAVEADGSYEPETGIVGHVPYTEHFLGDIAGQMIRLLYDSCKKPCKAVITDCDNTLWEGVAGEGNLHDIRISDHSKFVQTFLKRCVERGIPVGLASKNNPEDTIAVFEKHPDMVLNLSDISFMRINWKPKSINVDEILEEANLTQSGVVFIDDNPTECAEVRANCPEVTVVNLSMNPSGRTSYLKHFWAFDNLGVTREDADRVAMYREESARKSLRRQSTTFADYIADLEMNVVIRRPEPDEVARMSQLSLRTNQFTIGAKRRSESDLFQAIADNDAFIVRVSDRFGEYGLVGVVIGSADGQCYNLEDFYLSCRALGRGVEHRVLSYVGEHAAARGCSQVVIRFVYSGKNLPMAHFLNSVFNAGDAIVESKTYTISASSLEETRFDPNSIGDKPVSAPTKGGQIAAYLGLFPDSLLDKAATLSMSPETVVQGVSALRRQKSRSVNLQDTTTVPMQLPSDHIETELLAIWRETLGRDNISVLENFFDVGGRSILLPHIAERIQKRLQENVSLVDLFQYPTISMLAAKLRGGPVKNKDEELRRAVARQQQAFSRFKRKRADR